MLELRSDKAIIVGVVSDTHVPDRVKTLHPDLLGELKERGVHYIFHAGDVSTPGVLEDLETVAPVYAVSGNRDWFLRRSLPMHRLFHVNGVITLLTHGHIDAVHYWRDKVSNFINGYQFERYANRLSPLVPQAKLYIYGHSHHAENRWQEGKLFFNPGSCSIAEKPDFSISFGIIHFHPDGNFSGEIIELKEPVIRVGKRVQGDSDLSR